MPRSSKPSRHTNLGLVVALLAVWSLFTGLFGTDIMDAYRRHVADRVQDSIVRIDIGGHGTCTGFVIKADLVMTAAHCAEDDLTVDGAEAKLAYKDEFYDLALFKSKTARIPLEFRTAALVRGDHMMAIGYAGGEDFLMQMPGVLVLSRAKLPVERMPDLAPCLMASYIGIPGMSGGPVVDDQGRVLSVVSRGIPGMACGATPEILHSFLYDAGV